MSAFFEPFLGFVAWQTPVSFVSGIGAHHIYCKYWRKGGDRRIVVKNKGDESWTYSARSWAYILIATTLIIFIGWRTQTTADNTEALSKETVEYASQTNYCLNQVVEVLRNRNEIAKELDNLVDQRSEVVDRRAAAFHTFILGLTQIPVNQPQSERDRLAKPIIDQFLTDSSQIESDNDKINTDRAAVLINRAAHPYPDPACGHKLPGE